MTLALAFSLCLHVALFQSVVGSDVSLMQAIDFIGRWLTLGKFASFALPPVELFEKRFGPDSRWTKNYRFLCDIVKYLGNFDFRSKLIELYPQYRELKEQKDLAKAAITLSGTTVSPVTKKE